MNEKTSRISRGLSPSQDAKPQAKSTQAPGHRRAGIRDRPASADHDCAGLCRFARFAYTYIAVTNAARVGAGYGSSKPYTTATKANWELKIQQAVIGEMGTAFDAARISVPAPVVTTEADGQKRVRVQVSYPFATLVTWPAIPSNVTLTRAVEMRRIH